MCKPEQDEIAHEAIKEHAIVSLNLRETGALENDLPHRLGSDERIPLNEAEIEKVLIEARALTGESSIQVDDFLSRVDSLTTKYPDSRQVKKGSLL